VVDRAVDGCQSPHGRWRQALRSNHDGYDAFGNVTQVTDAMGRTTTTEYGSATRIYPPERLGAQRRLRHFAAGAAGRHSTLASRVWSF